MRALPGDKGNMSHSLPTLEARGLIVIGRSPGGNAEFLWLTPEGQKGAAQLAGSCDEGETDVAPMGYRACNSLYGAPAPLSAGGSSKMASKVRKGVRKVSIMALWMVMTVCLLVYQPWNTASAKRLQTMRRRFPTTRGNGCNIRRRVGCVIVLLGFTCFIR